MKPLYFAPTTLLTSTGTDGSATPITPAWRPKAPKPLELRDVKLLTMRPEVPMLISSKLEAKPKEFKGYAVSAPRLVLEQPPVTVEEACSTGPTRNGCA